LENFPLELNKSNPPDFTALTTRPSLKGLLLFDCANETELKVRKIINKKINFLRIKLK
jgi:hypothetical protein